MPINVNGYNDTFQNFVDFARIMVDGQGNANSIARVSTGVNVADGALAGRTITASSTDSIRGIFKWFRAPDDRTANNETRKIFRDAIADMFGGESKIPEAVRKAMVLGDYDKGKPLTARRILAVQAAIDASGTKETRSEKLRLESFESTAVEQAARNMGYVKGELPKLARAAHFYAEAKGVSEADALREVGRPGSEANRLMNYGGRFLESAANFADGLRLIATFSEWHDDLSAAYARISCKNPDYGALDTPTKVNVFHNAGQPGAKAGLERFIFEDIASNPDYNLSETDAERAFGIEHNPASRQLLVSNNGSVLGTIANVPPEKRRTVYAAFNAFQTLAESGPQRGDRKFIQLESLFLTRVLRHLPKLEAILSKTGTLTGRDVIKTCYPDIRNPDNYDADTLNTWGGDLNDTMDKLQEEGEMTGADRAAITSMMESSGATFEEARNAYESEKKIPPNRYFSTLQFSLLEAAPTAESGIDTMKGDIGRISTYTNDTDGANAFPEENHSWKFTFPDGERLKTNGARKDDIPRVEQKIRQLCGEVHQKQIGAVAFLLSQAGTGVLRDRPLAQYGINSDEHSPVDFALSRNDETGAVTVTYTSPKELPVQFTWTATVAVDGTVTSTPFTVTGAAIRELGDKDAKAMLKDAAQAMGRNLSKAELSTAAEILKRNAAGFLPKTAKLFAQFLVKLPLDGAHAESTGKKADAFAKEMKDWRDIELGDMSVSDVADAIKADANAYIAGKFHNPEAFGKQGKPDYANVFTAMIADANRIDYTIGGERINGTGPGDGDPANATIAAFKNAAVTEKAQKALSSIMHQGGINKIQFLAMEVPGENGKPSMHDLPGGKMFAARNMASGFMLPLLDDDTMNLSCNLDISPDGDTATVTFTLTPGLTVGTQKGDNFGSVKFTQQMTVDLRPEVPVVTDVRLAQELS